MDHRSFGLALALLRSSLSAGQKMKPLVLLVFFVALMSILGYAQPSVGPSRSAPEESVTVTGFKSREVLDKFVKSFAAPTKLTGKIARWENGICPVAVRQPPAFTAFVTARVKAIAAAVGAPVSALPRAGKQICSGKSGHSGRADNVIGFLGLAEPEGFEPSIRLYNRITV